MRKGGKTQREREREMERERTNRPKEPYFQCEKRFWVKGLTKDDKATPFHLCHLGDENLSLKEGTMSSL